MGLVQGARSPGAGLIRYTLVMGIEIEDDQPVEPHQGLPAIERVFTDEETKLYRAHAKLMYLDGSVFDFDDTLIEFEHMLPVFSADGRKIGHAAVFYKADLKEFSADIVIDYASEERLLAEIKGSIKIYARPYGTMSFGHMLFLDPAARLKPTRLRLQGITLSPDPGADPRCKPFGEPQ